MSSQVSRRVAVLAGVAVVGLAVLVFCGRSREGEEAARFAEIGSPVMLFAGTVEQGRSTQVPIPIRNHSDDSKRLIDFRTSDDRGTLYRHTRSGAESVTSVELAAESEVTLYLDLPATGPPGQIQETILTFRDAGTASEYFVRVQLVPVTRLYVANSPLKFWTMPQGEERRIQVELRSDGSFHGDPMPGVTLSRPDLFTCTFTPATAADRAVLLDRTKGQHLVGHLNVTLRPTAPVGEVAETLTIREGDRELLHLPVTATVVPREEKPSDH